MVGFYNPLCSHADRSAGTALPEVWAGRDTLLVKFHMHDMFLQFGYTAQVALFIFRKRNKDTSGLVNFNVFAQGVLYPWDWPAAKPVSKHPPPTTARSATGSVSASTPLPHKACQVLQALRANSRAVV